MIDAEVARLRRLRNTALRARAIAAALDSDPTERSAVLSAGAQLCWRIARLMTGQLRAHPYLNYQRGPSEVRAAFHRVSAAVLGAIARYRGRHRQIYAEELRHVARELDDTRALTWSADLGDALGRLQTQIRRLLQEMDAGALGLFLVDNDLHCWFGGVSDDTAARLDGLTDRSPRITRETTDFETPARRATSMIVGGLDIEVTSIILTGTFPLGTFPMRWPGIARQGATRLNCTSV